MSAPQATAPHAGPAVSSTQQQVLMQRVLDLEAMNRQLESALLQREHMPSNGLQQGGTVRVPEQQQQQQCQNQRDQEQQQQGSTHNGEVQHQHQAQQQQQQQRDREQQDAAAQVARAQAEMRMAQERVGALEAALALAEQSSSDPGVCSLLEMLLQIIRMV